MGSGTIAKSTPSSFLSASASRTTTTSGAFSSRCLLSAYSCRRCAAVAPAALRTNVTTALPTPARPLPNGGAGQRDSARSKSPVSSPIAGIAAPISSPDGLIWFDDLACVLRRLRIRTALTS